MIRQLMLALAAALLAAPAAAQQPPPPSLLVVIRVDGLSSDLFAEYRPQFSGGLARLATGTVFPNASAAAPSGPALGDQMRTQWPASRSVAVSGSRAADPSEAGQRFYWTGTRFATDSAALAPPAVEKVNAAIAAALAQPRPPLDPTPFCQAKPGDNRLGRAAGDAVALAASPELDGDTLALAAGLTDQLQLGRAAKPDMISVGLSATGNVGRSYGSAGEAMCLQLTELDREIGDFLSFLDGREVDYAVALTGGGAAQVPLLFWRPGFRGATVHTPANTNDILPTLAALIELPLPAESGVGHCLEGTPAFCQQR